MITAGGEFLEERVFCDERNVRGEGGGLFFLGVVFESGEKFSQFGFWKAGGITGMNAKLEV